jgi:hypothetical protein
MPVRSATLDANDETFFMTVDAGQRGTATMDFTGTITVTWALSVPGGSSFIPLRKSDDSTAAVYTADDYIQVQGPCTIRATASSVSGGTCLIEGRTQRLT